MEANLGLLGTAGGGGGGGRVSSGGSASGSMSTVSQDQEDNLVLTSEESSSYPDESELELGLGLSLGCSGGSGGGMKSKSALTPASERRGHYSRILTAKDFPSVGSNSSCVKSPSSLSSSSSSSSITKVNFLVGTKRTADSDSPSTNGGVSQVVGWPPIRAYRMNSLANQAKSRATEEFHSTFEKIKSKNGVIHMNSSGSDENNNNVKEKGLPKSSMFVKVNMDGLQIGRKVDLKAHSCYETLAQTLEDMFCRPTTNIGAKRSSIEEHEATGSSKLLDGSSEFVLAYEDKDGDWMLVGDVPWGMFLSSVKRLRITRTSEDNGLGSRFQERNGSQSKPI